MLPRGSQVDGGRICILERWKRHLLAVDVGNSPISTSVYEGILEECNVELLMLIQGFY